MLQIFLPMVGRGAAMAGRGAAGAGRGALKAGAVAGRGVARAAGRNSRQRVRHGRPDGHKAGHGRARAVQSVARGGRHPADHARRQVDRGRRGGNGHDSWARQALHRARSGPATRRPAARPPSPQPPDGLLGGLVGGGDAVGGAEPGDVTDRLGRQAGRAAGGVARHVVRPITPWPLRRLLGRRAAARPGRRVRRALLAVVLVFGIPLGITYADDAATGPNAADVLTATPEIVAAIAEATGVPQEPVEAYLSAASTYAEGGVDWALLAGIGQRECHHGELQMRGCNPRGTINSKGARGPMQFLGSTWRGSAGQYDLDVSGPPVCAADGEPDCERTSGYATDGDDDGEADPWNWLDATHSAARMLVANDVADDPRRALRAYNPSDSYVDAVMGYAEDYREQVADIDLEGSGGGGGGGGSGGGTPGDCDPVGSTDPPPGSDFEARPDGRLTTKTRQMLEAAVGCYGRGAGLGCYGNRASGEHPRGRACDFMFAELHDMPVPAQVDRGWKMARWLQANAEELHVMYVIWQDQIWSVARQREGWREYERYPECEGGPTPTCRTRDHYDHIHVSVEA